MSADKILVEYDIELKAAKKKMDDFEASFKSVDSAAKNSGQIVSESFTKTSKSASVLQNDLKKVSTHLQEATQTERVTQFGDKTASSFGKITSAANQMPGALGNASNGVSNLAQSFKALLANPVVLVIAAIVAALYGLFKAFTSTDSGANEFNAIMEELSAVVDVVRQRAINLTDAIGNLFKGNFTQAAKDFGKAVSTNVDDFASATKAARAYTFALDELEDSEANYISNRAENANKIARLEFLASDRSKSFKERRDALVEAIKLGEEESAQNIKFAQKKLDEEVKYLAGKAMVTKEAIIEFLKLSDEQQKVANQDIQRARNNYDTQFEELEKYYAAVVNADTAFYNENKRNNSKLSTLNETFAQEELEKRIKRNKENEIKSENSESILTRRLGESKKFLEQEKELQFKANQEAIDDKKVSSDAFFDIEKERFDKELELEKKLAEEKQAIRQASLELAKQSLTLLSNINEISLNNELANLKKQLDKKQISQEEFEEQSKRLAMEKANRDKQIAIFEAVINTAVAVSKVIANPILVALAVALGAAQIATIAAQPLPEFEKGTKYLQRGKNKQGVDTIPLLANEGEAIIPTDINRKHKDIVGAMFDGNLNELIERKYIAPALRQYKEAHESKSNSNFADKIAASLALQNQFTDKDIVKRLDKVSRVSQENTYYLGKVMRRNHNPRLP